MKRSKDEFSWQDYVREQAVDCKHPILQSFYQSQVFAPDLTIANAEFVAMDFETTGLDLENDEIVSIGLVPFTLDRIKIAQARHWIVRPQCSLTSDSIVIHGITHSDVSAAPELHDVLQQVLDCLKERVVVVHYQFVEREFLNRAVYKLYGEELLFPMMDTMWLE